MRVKGQLVKGLGGYGKESRLYLQKEAIIKECWAGKWHSGDGEEGRGQIGGKGAIADGGHCLEQNVPRPSLVLGRVPGQEDTCSRAHATLPTFPGDGYLRCQNRGNALHVKQLGFLNGLNKNTDDTSVCIHSWWDYNGSNKLTLRVQMAIWMSKN